MATHLLVCYVSSCTSLYTCFPKSHQCRPLTMLADLSSPDDDDMIITLLLLAACDLAINKAALFHESLTVDEIRRRSGKIRRHALQHPLSSPFWTFLNSNHDDTLITLCGHTSFELLHQLFKPYFDSFTPC